MSTQPLAIPRPPLTALDVEASAQACLRQCMEKLALKDLPIPVPVEQWIEGPLAIRFGVSDLLHLGKDVLGAAFISKGEILISETLLSNEGRYRFTCAHELGHFILHGHLNQAFRDTDVEPGTRGDVEHEADRFGAAFLMPATLVMQEFFNICAERRIDPGRLMVALMESATESLTVWKRIILPAVTRKFGVSLSAAVFRFRELVLPNGTPFIPVGQVQALLTKQS
ncbi:MAG: ImmA/IrrE family metallo-endopeptidase [Tepidisphaeraceae bacterium]|jgi:Zn-dependent peptidase ImmA (M78 family)